MRICPADCAICTDPVCRNEGCKETGEIMFEVCDWCGDPFSPNGCVAVCVTCLDKEE